jgi:Heterokaryon incompatibility protein (HET)
MAENASLDGSVSWRQRLCDQCGTIDFEKALHHAISDQQLGLLDDISTRASICDFCDLVSTVVTKKLQSYAKFKPVPDGIPIVCTLDGPVTFHGSVVESHICIKFRDKEAKHISYTDRLAECQLRFCPVPPPIADGTPTWKYCRKFSGRIVGPKVDTEFLRGWLQLCESHHGVRCSQPAWIDPPEPPSKLYVIDVNQMNVVYAPKQCRYAALSYVWGRSTANGYFRNSKENFAALQQEKGLTAQSLPQTVKDAIDLVSKMGERYLWVDSICIIQDDPVVVNAQINQMDLIYAQAVFTIVAATGQNADAGLPRLHNPNMSLPQKLCQVGRKLNIMTEIEARQSQCLKNAWRTRGWTCQEDLLSKRQLVFTDTQVFWRCLEDSWTEEIVTEPSGPDDEPDRGRVIDLYDSHELLEKTTRFSLVHYASIVNEYAKRSFTNEADIVDACKGFINRISRFNGENFHWGLPQSRLEEAILWTRFSPTTRRNCSYTLHYADGSANDVKIPSWTWLGWRGNLAWEGTTLQPQWYRQFKVDERLKRKSDLDWYKIGVDGDRVLLERPLRKRGSKEKPLPPWKGSASAPDQPPKHSSRMRRLLPPWRSSRRTPSSGTANSRLFKDSGRIQVETSYASLRIQKFAGKSVDGYSWTRKGVSTTTFNILDLDDGVMAGMGLWAGGDFEDIGDEPIVRHFMVVAENGFAKDYKTVGDANVPVNVQYELDLLMIKWDTPDVASKAGVFSIMEKDWMKLDLEWRLITLH